MKYTNAEKGIKKVFVSQIFAIIAAVLNSATSLFVGMLKVVFTGALALSTLELMILSVSFGIALLMMVILSTVMGIVGYYQAGKDEGDFVKSMLCLIANGVLIIIGQSFQIPNGTLYTILITAGTIVEMFVIVFSISGVIKISDSLECSEMSDRGSKLLTILTITFIISAINALIIRIFELSEQAKIVSVIIDMVDLALIVLRYVLYLRYLRGTVKMLADNSRNVLRG